MPDLINSPSYRYWQENGKFWPKEYEQRMKSQILYHAQEIMLADYLSHFTPARVLEYGCGFGRHLKYLSKITGLDIYGYDQSPTMLAGIADWASREWIRSHVVLGEPVGRLPYPDRYFDIVYTAEVLVHVHPRDIVAILTELLRVAKQQVFHLETAADYPLNTHIHDGCWYHDFLHLYSEMGYQCEMLPQGYQAHIPYRVLHGSTHSVYSGSPILAQQLARLESDLQSVLDDVSTKHQLEQQVGELQKLLAAKQSHIATLQNALDQQARATDTVGKELGQTQSVLRQTQFQLAQAQSQAAEYFTFVKEIQSVLHPPTGD